MLIVDASTVNEAKLTFASYYNDHMVFQQAPKKSIVWGYADTADIGKTLNIVLSANGIHTSTYQTTIKLGKLIIYGSSYT